jgi:NADPH2 dehydrogenase
LKELKLAYVHLVESRISGNADVEATEKCDPLIDIWAGTSPILLAGGFTPDSARQDVDEVYNDKDVAVVFGRSFIANPDLVYRMKEGIPFTKYDRDTFYKAKSKDGYIDYPYSAEWEKEHSKL